MPWLKHKKDDEPEVGIGDHDFSQFVKNARRDPQRFKAVQSVFDRLKRSPRKETNVQLNVKLKSC
ncbi:hypothetical protein PY93_11440 [Lacticaseibacillus rhamnosus]|uniref:hypothetical protein n=1 Tax=Lacticaseibacillus rhamnosus TaxID=47715 RepID=UPI0007E1CCF7|nr:hypothetical protein [Lacticaseibacillus rhamnosus]OAU48374.1 hypothetical protein PY93_11440 [Lacticaseibacillus rhamnosus]